MAHRALGRVQFQRGHTGGGAGVVGKSIAGGARGGPASTRELSANIAPALPSLGRTQLVIPGGLIVVNEQLSTGNGTTTEGLTGNSVHVYLTGLGDIIVASAHAEVDLALPPPPGCNPCDDGNPCNGVETCDQLLGCQPGTPPSTMCTTTTVSSTTTTTIATCGDGQLQSPEQCDPPASLTCPAPPGSPPLSCQSDCACPNPCPPISFVVATTGKVGNSGQVTGGIGSDNVGGMFGIGKGVFLSDGSDLIGDRIQIGRGSSVFLFRVGRSGQVRGTVCAATSKSDKRVVLICPS